MKKTLLFVTVAALMTSGCSKTWSGIKQDSHEIMVNTKEVIHNATAPDEYVTASGQRVNVVSSSSVQIVDRVDPSTVQTAQYTPNNNVQTITPASANNVQVFEDTPTVTTTAN